MVGFVCNLHYVICWRMYDAISWGLSTVLVHHSLRTPLNRWSPQCGKRWEIRGSVSTFNAYVWTMCVAWERTAQLESVAHSIFNWAPSIFETHAAYPTQYGYLQTHTHSAGLHHHHISYHQAYGQGKLVFPFYLKESIWVNVSTRTRSLSKAMGVWPWYGADAELFLAASGVIAAN